MPTQVGQTEALPEVTTGATRRTVAIPGSLRLLLSDRRAALGLAILLFYLAVALIGPIVFSGDPTKPDYTIRPSSPPSVTHWLGTDQGGRDMFLQLVDGAWPSMLIGFAVAALATTLSIVVGVIAGYMGRQVDSVLMLMTNVFLIIPGLPLVIVVASYVETDSSIPIIIILALTGWAFGARVLRSQTLSLRARDFILASVIRGETGWRVMFVDLLPNMTSLVVANFIGAVAGAIAASAGLQFLGLGNINQVSWYTMLYWAQNYGAIQTGAWWTFVPAGLAIAVLITGLSFINYGIDAVSNPRLRESGSAAPIGPRPVGTATVARPAVSFLPTMPLQNTDSTLGKAVLDVRDLRVEYLTRSGPTRAVDGVSFTIGRGEVFGLAGESGCGKTTVAHALLRIGSHRTVADGSVLFHGQELLRLDDTAFRQMRWTRLSLVPQSAMNALSPVRSIGSHFVDTFQAHRRISKADALDSAAQLLDMVGIERARLASYPHQLSGGMRQRVMIALALALDPDLVVMDEPTSALDVVVQREILQQIGDLQARLGFSVLFITHDLSLLVEISDRIAIMYAGQIVEESSGHDLFRDPRHPYARGLMNSFPPVDGGEVPILTGIPGSPPDPRAPSTGCRFHPRCSKAMDICRTEEPPLTPREGRLTACHLYRPDESANEDVSGAEGAPR